MVGVSLYATNIHDHWSNTECLHGLANGLKLHGNIKIYDDDDDDDDNDNKPSDHEIDVSEASFFAGPQKSNLRVNS